VIARKVAGLSEVQLGSSRLPSGWTPLELLNHLVHMERAGCAGTSRPSSPEPWGDQDASGGWRVGPEDTAAGLLAAMDAGGAHTRAIAAGAELTDGATGE
jgi:hypothetical protein